MATQGGRDTELNLFGCPGRYKTILSKNTVNKPCPICRTAIKKEPIWAALSITVRPVRGYKYAPCGGTAASGFAAVAYLMSKRHAIDRKHHHKNEE
jgi:hypothetical protein